MVTTWPAAPARAVRPERWVGLVLDRRIRVHDERDVVDMDSSGRDVRGHECRSAPVGERGEVALTRALRQVAVQVDGADAGRFELAGELLGAVLRPREDHHAAGTGHVGDLGEAILVIDHEHTMVEQNRCLDASGMRHGIVHVPRNDGVDAAGEGRGEEHPLARGRRRVQDALDHGQEALVGHVVGLVQHADLDAIKADVARLHEVDESARAGDDPTPAVALRWCP
jgi:hypothetical protein